MRLRKSTMSILVLASWRKLSCNDQLIVHDFFQMHLLMTFRRRYHRKEVDSSFLASWLVRSQDFRNVGSFDKSKEVHSKSRQMCGSFWKRPNKSIEIVATGVCVEVVGSSPAFPTVLRRAEDQMGPGLLTC